VHVKMNTATSVLFCSNFLLLFFEIKHSFGVITSISHSWRKWAWKSRENSYDCNM